MVERITVVSEEVDDFILELKIDADATFYDLHQIILTCCRYREHGMSRFHICNEYWEPETSIVLDNAQGERFDEDVYHMKDTRLSEFLEEEQQRFSYVFDPENGRSFLLELTETLFGSEQKQPICSRRHGEAPIQFRNEESLISPTVEPTSAREDIDETFYGDDGFADDDFDPEGFEIRNGESIE